jgi:glycosyltransferase involved in cell wall biosynthesis
MKVVYLLDWFLYYATELSNAMAETDEVLLVPRDHNFEVSSPDAPTSLDEYLARTLSPKVKTDRIKFRRLDPRSVLEVFRLNRLIRRWGADVVHIQETADWRIVLLAFLNRKRQVVLTIHDIEKHPGERRGGVQRVLFRILVHLAKKIIVHGHELREHFLRVFPEREGQVEIASIPIGVLSLYRAWYDPEVGEESHTVLFFGRIAPYKGLEDLIAAQPRVTAAIPDARFVIAGSGRFDGYRQLIRDDKAFEIHNRFIPNQEVPPLFRRAAVVVLPYLEASQTAVVPIAYDFGKPVIVTRIGGLPEVVDDGESGLVVEPGNPEQLARAIIRVIGDDRFRKHLAKGARRIAETRLSWKAIAAQTARLYGQRP